MTPFLLGYLAFHEKTDCPYDLEDIELVDDWGLGYDTARFHSACARPTSQSETPQGVAARSIPGASPPFKVQFNRGGKEQP